VVKARKKPLDVIDPNRLGVGKTASRAELIALAPLTPNRTPKEIKGTPREMAVQIATILKEEAKVIS
jgi:electron transfer flavoprotein alpha/beta subunit